MAVDIEIRPFQVQDLPRILTLTIAGFEGVSIDHRIEQQFGYVEPGWQERKVADVKRAAANEPQGIYVAVEENSVVGFVTVVTSQEKSLGRIADLVVEERLRKQGLGRRLLETALGYIKSQGLHFAKIETLENNAAGRVLYPKLGFKEVARQIHYVMRLDDDGTHQSK